jgi:hypothetical protein
MIDIRVKRYAPKVGQDALTNHQESDDRVGQRLRGEERPCVASSLHHFSKHYSRSSPEAIGACLHGARSVSRNQKRHQIAMKKIRRFHLGRSIHDVSFR